MHDPDQEFYDRVSFLLNEVEARLEESFPDEALQIALQAQRLLNRARIESLDLRIDTHYLLASCHFDLHDLANALREYENVRQLDRNDPEIDYWQARALFHSWRFKEANDLIERYDSGAATRAAALYYQALSADFLGDHVRADDLFARSEAEDAAEYPRPIRVPPNDVQEMMNEVLYSLPVDVRRAVQSVRFHLLPLPDARVHASPDVDPLDPGVYRKARGEHHPDTIEVFQRNLERVSSDRDDLREELRLALLSKIGNFLGWDGRDLGLRSTN